MLVIRDVKVYFRVVVTCFILVYTTGSCRCSDGIDRHRQEWLQRGCHEDVSVYSHKLPFMRLMPHSNGPNGILFLPKLLIVLFCGH